MTDIAIIQNKTNAAPDVIEAFYTDSSINGTRVKAFTASNSTETSISYKAYIYDSTGVLVSAVIPMTIVVRDRTSYGQGIVNQVIPPGGSLRVESSNIGLNFYVTGYVQSV